MSQQALHQPRLQRYSGVQSDARLLLSKTGCTAGRQRGEYVCLSLGGNIVHYKCKNPPLQRTPPFSPAPIQRVLTAVSLGKPGPCGLATTPGLLTIGYFAAFKLYQHFLCETLKNTVHHNYCYLPLAACE